MKGGYSSYVTFLSSFPDNISQQLRSQSEWSVIFWLLFSISALELTHFCFFPSAINGDNSSSYSLFWVVTSIITKHQYICLFPLCHFIRVKVLNPYKLMNLVRVSPNLIKFSKYLKKSPGLVPPPCIFFHPFQLPFLQKLSFVAIFFFIS